MRFVVVGTSGAGKSTFGRRLAAAMESSFVELDELHWSENWVERSDAEFSEAVSAATAGERWVVDGNYSAVRDLIWPRATHIVWLNFSRRVVFSRIIWRTFRRGLFRERLWHGNRESLARAFLSKDSVLLWSFTTFSSNRLKYRALRGGTKYGHLKWLEFTAASDANAFLAGFTTLPG